MFKPVLSAALATGLLVSGAFAQDAAELDAEIAATTNVLIEQALSDEVGLGFVEDLTTEVGQRLAGSDAEQRARTWAVNELTELGFDNPRVEAFEIPFWSRTSESVAVVSPSPQPLIATALGGSAATPKDGVTAEVVRFESLAELQAAPISKVDGRIVFIDETMIKTMDYMAMGLPVVSLIRSVGSRW